MIRSPILIVGCARSGTTLLYNILSEVAPFWSIGIESKAIIEHFHHPSVKGWESGELTAADLTAESRAYILGAFEAGAAPGDFWRRVNRFRSQLNNSTTYAALKRRGRTSAIGSGVSSGLPGGGLGIFRAYVRVRNRVACASEPIRLLDKSPEHCLRLPFLASLFPDVRVIFLTRDGRANIHSLLEGWRQPHIFPGYDTPMSVTSPGQSRGRWAFTLIPGWREWVDRPLEEICAQQWVVSNGAILDYIASPHAPPVLTVRYEDLIANSNEILSQIAGFLDIVPEDIPAFGRTLPEVNVVSQPGFEKWRREETAISHIEPKIRPMMARLGYESDR